MSSDPGCTGHSLEAWFQSQERCLHSGGKQSFFVLAPFHSCSSDSHLSPWFLTPNSQVWLCLAMLHWAILHLFKHSLPVPVGQTTSCQIMKKRQYERESIANYSSKLLSQTDWGDYQESMYPACRYSLDCVFLPWHDGQQYWMSFIPYEWIINESRVFVSIAVFTLYGPEEFK